MAISNGDIDSFGFIVANQQAGARPGGLTGAMYDFYRDDYAPDAAPSAPRGLNVI